MAAPGGSLPWQHPAAALTEQNPFVMGTKPILANSCVATPRNPVRLKSATLSAEAMQRGTRLNTVSKFTRSSCKQITQLCAF